MVNSSFERGGILPQGFSLVFWKQAEDACEVDGREVTGEREALRRLDAVFGAAREAVWWKCATVWGENDLDLCAGFGLRADKMFRSLHRPGSPWEVGLVDWNPEDRLISMQVDGPCSGVLNLWMAPDHWVRELLPGGRRYDLCEPLAGCRGLAEFPQVRDADQPRVTLLAGVAKAAEAYADVCPLCMVAATRDYPGAALRTALAYCTEQNQAKWEQLEHAGRRPTPDRNLGAEGLARMCRLLADLPRSDWATAVGLWHDWFAAGIPADDIEHRIAAAFG